MPDTAISVENLSKAYRIGLKEEIPDTLAAAALAWAKYPLRNFHRLRRLNTFSANGNGADEEDIVWALRDVSFEVERGEVVGIIGRNGAGKSTLLKILSRITDPTSGRAVIRGRVSSLLEVGTGFHPELTGRENIYMNGTILGMRKREIDRKFDQIVEFSGVEKFLDTPVKRYSSGMKVRLAFAVAAHLEPEILIVDEVLAVGDFEFQKKCLGKMNEVARGGRTVLFVSHNMAAVESLCTRALLLDQGRLCESGDVADILASYHSCAQPTEPGTADLTSHPGRPHGRTPVLRSFRLTDATGNPLPGLTVGSDATFELTLETQQYLPNVSISLRVSTITGARVCTLNSRFQQAKTLDLGNSGTARCVMKNCRLAPGEYRVTTILVSSDQWIDEVEDAAIIHVRQSDVYLTGRIPSAAAGSYWPEARWSFTNNSGGMPSTSSTAIRKSHLSKSHLS